MECAYGGKHETLTLICKEIADNADSTDGTDKDAGKLEDDLEVAQDFWSKNSKKDDPIKMITDELPDPKLLDLYK